jgi:hypothetical protein
VRFLDFLQSLSDRPKARELYYHLAKRYARWLGADLESLSKEHFSDFNVRRYLSTIENPYTANAFLSMCRSFARYIRFSVPYTTVEEVARCRQILQLDKADTLQRNSVLRKCLIHSDG